MVTATAPQSNNGYYTVGTAGHGFTSKSECLEIDLLDKKVSLASDLRMDGAYTPIIYYMIIEYGFFSDTNIKLYSNHATSNKGNRCCSAMAAEVNINSHRVRFIYGNRGQQFAIYQDDERCFRRTYNAIKKLMGE